MANEQGGDDKHCEECGGVGAHRGGCTKGDTTGRGWLVCDCGTKIWLLPVKDYMVEQWEGCHTKHLCVTCPLNNMDKLLAKVKEVFGG